jgi:hypothetical protein
VIDARDKDSLPFAGSQKPHRLIDAGLAAGEHGDAVRRFYRPALLSVDGADKDEESDGHRDGQHQQRVEK